MCGGSQGPGFLITDSPKSGVDHKSNAESRFSRCARRPLTEIISAPPRTGSEPNQGHPLVLAAVDERNSSRVFHADKKFHRDELHPPGQAESLSLPFSELSPSAILLRPRATAQRFHFRPIFYLDFVLLLALFRVF